MKNKIVTLFINNWPIKILSIVIAIILSLFFKVISLESRFLTVPLTVRYSPTIIAAGYVPEVIKIEIRGKAEDIVLFAENDLSAFVDFQDISQPGRYSAIVNIKRSSAALGIENVEIIPRPSMLSIMLENKIGKFVKVDPNTVGWTAKGFSIVSTIVKPETIYIEGPESLLNNVTTVSTRPIDISGKINNFTVITNATSSNRLIHFPNGSEIEYSAFVQEVIIEKDFDDVEIVVVGLDSSFDYKLDVNSGTIKFQAKQLLMEKVNATNMTFMINCSSIKVPGTYTLPVETLIPQGLVTLNYSPTQVKIEVVVKQ